MMKIASNFETGQERERERLMGKGERKSENLRWMN